VPEVVTLADEGFDNKADWEDDETTLPDFPEPEVQLGPLVHAQGGDYKLTRSSVAWLDGRGGFEFFLDSSISGSTRFFLEDALAVCLEKALAHELEAHYQYEFVFSRPPHLRTAVVRADYPVVSFDADDQPTLQVSSSKGYDRIVVRIASARATLNISLDPPVAIALHDIIAGLWMYWEPHEAGAHDDPNRNPSCPWCAFWLRQGPRPPTGLRGPWVKGRGPE
jgi:hypothetical protein